MDGVLGGAVAVVFVDGSDHVAHVVLLEESGHFLVDVLSPFVGSEGTRVVSDHSHEALVGVDEVVFVGEEVNGLCACGCTDEDYEVFVAFVRFGGDLAAKVAVDIVPWNGGSLLGLARRRAIRFSGLGSDTCRTRELWNLRVVDAGNID